MTDTLHILRHSDLVARPWKNGGGITRELASATVEGRMAWRLSMAEVATEGPFSDFSGYFRILTVIRGDSMVLHSPDGALQADPGRPVSFDGATAITATLSNGAIEDFNLIFDPDLCAGSVVAVNAMHDDCVTAGEDETVAVVCVTGTMTCGDHVLKPGDTALLEQGSMDLSVGGTGLLVRLQTLGAPLIPVLS